MEMCEHCNKPKSICKGELFHIDARLKIDADVWPQWFDIDNVGEVTADDVLKLHFAAVDAGLSEQWFRVLKEVTRLNMELHRATSDAPDSVSPINPEENENV